jgi:hypothetical protein
MAAVATVVPVTACTLEDAFMLSTSFALIAFVASANSTAQLNWESDYAKAYNIAVQKQRPLAVFIGEGKNGPAQLVKDGVSDNAAKLLTESYVVVYIDTATESGKKLAQSYDMAQGLIIGDRSGAKQAARLAGTLTGDDLNTALVRFADPSLVVTTTATTPAPVYVAPISPCASGRCPNAR